MNPALINQELATTSRIMVLIALTVYVISFLVLTVSLANRAKATRKEQTASALRVENIGLILAGLATLIHGAGVLTRGIAANRVLFFKDIRFIATFVIGFVVLVIGSANTLFYVQVESLMPALQDYWLVIHVSVAILGTAFFTIAAALAALLLIKSGKSKSKVLKVFPDVEKLEKLSYQFNVIGFILWTFTLIAGAIWADKAWHRFWGWDTKEVWTFIIWTIYAAYLHATTTRGWEGKKAAWLTLIGFSAVIFNFTIVNLFFKGLHVYSGL